jgi:nitronate monooxygenase
MTRAISGRPARTLANLFSVFGSQAGDAAPAYPIAYDAGKALNAAAKVKGEFGWGAQWAGQAAPLSRALPAEALMRALKAELVASRESRSSDSPV